MNYPFILALGLMFLAATSIVHNPNGRVVTVVVAVVLFLLAAIGALHPGAVCGL